MTKTTLLFLSLALSGSSLAHGEHVVNSSVIRFPHCGGFAKIKEHPKTISIKIKNVKHCRNVKIDGIKYSLKGRRNHFSPLKIRINKSRHHKDLKIKLFSRKRHRKDVKFVHIPSLQRVRRITQNSYKWRTPRKAIKYRVYTL